MKNKAGGISRRKFLGQAAILSGVVIIPRHVLGGKGFTAPSDKITLGFIGTGKQSIGLANNFMKLENTQLVAACDVYQAKLQNFITKADAFYTSKSGQGAFKAVKAYEDFRALLAEKDINAVVIVSPDHWHAVQAIQAAEAGKDIYCEKPLSLTVKEGRAMVRAARKHDRVFQTGSMQRSWPEFRQTAELIRNGYIGEIKTVKVSVGGPPLPYDLPKEELPKGLNWDMWLGPNEYVHYNNQLAPAIDANIWARWRYYKGLGGGDLTDWGAHMFDIVQWSLDMDSTGPVEIIPPNGADVQHLTYKYSNGITVTREDFGKNHAVRFIGTKGQLDVQRGKLETSDPALVTKVIGPDEIRVYNSTNHYIDFIDAIRSRKKPVCDIEIGHRSATVCNLGNIALEVNRPLKWNPHKEKFRGDKEANQLLGRKLRPEWSFKM
ncbi:MAG: Gfo/Idh/MocA family oxidoreductase [Chitinophagaceae bacterium]|nr:MAG: Gfo/Idh/MocA family oxidoreductase [Chitinophagaceae bacterium]